MFKVELNYFSRFFLLIFTVILILNCSTSSNLEQKFDSSSGSSSISENIPIKKDLGLNNYQYDVLENIKNHRNIQSNGDSAILTLDVIAEIKNKINIEQR